MVDNSSRFCVFCGKRPEEKTGEHVIPRWLIEATGDPKRQISLGPFLGRDERYKEFSFDQLRFPACKSCNEKYGLLEEKAQQVMVRLLAAAPACSSDFDLLLDWFDKVRVGLWLGYHQMLDHNFWGISPNFHIADRIGATDRAIVIYRTQRAEQRINFIGYNTPAFAHLPTCFGLIINEYLFVSVATDFLVSRQAGLPYPRSVTYLGESRAKFEAPTRPGKNRLHAPILDLAHDRRGTVVAQGVYQKWQSRWTEAYKSKYVRNATLHDGRLRPIVESDRSVQFFPASPSMRWLPRDVVPRHELFETLLLQILDMQTSLFRRIHVSPDIETNKRLLIMQDFAQCIKFNDALVSIWKEQAKVDWQKMSQGQEQSV